jgi:thiamine-phosphate pyrophosphorylase
MAKVLLRIVSHGHAFDWRLCLVADAEASDERNIPSLVSDALDGGVTWVQLRAKKLSSKAFLDLGLRLSRFLRRRRIPLIINDRVDIALACQASGVHLGQEDLPLAKARKILGQKRLIGISVNTLEEAQIAERGGADYLGVGPIFPTLTKPNSPPVLGVGGLQDIRKLVRIPLIAIGGIQPGNAREVMVTGADGVAVVSAIMGAENARLAARELFEALKL